MDGKKIALISLGAIALGVGGYFGYKAIKKAITGTQDDSLDTPKPILSGGTPSSGGGGGSSNPFSTKAQLKAFQKWVIDVKGDKTILGSGGDSGFGDDGLWGSKSAKAWAKYGNEYKNSQSGMGGSTTTTPSNNPSSLDFVTLKSMLNNFEKPVNNDSKLQIATSSDRPRILIDFYSDGTMVFQKDLNWYSPTYAKSTGTWSIVNNQGKLNLGGKTATVSQTDNNGIWSILKQTNYLNPVNGQFVPFVEDAPVRTRNRSQLDMRCEDLM
jgi:hypothetical protein